MFNFNHLEMDYSNKYLEDLLFNGQQSSDYLKFLNISIPVETPTPSRPRGFTPFLPNVTLNPVSKFRATINILNLVFKFRDVLNILNPNSIILLLLLDLIILNILLAFFRI